MKSLMKSIIIGFLGFASCTGNNSSDNRQDQDTIFHQQDNIPPIDTTRMMNDTTDSLPPLTRPAY